MKSNVKTISIDIYVDVLKLQNRHSNTFNISIKNLEYYITTPTQRLNLYL